MSRGGAAADTIEVEGRIRVLANVGYAVAVWCTACRQWLGLAEFTLSVLRRTPVCHTCRRRRAEAARVGTVPQRRGRSGWTW